MKQMAFSFFLLIVILFSCNFRNNGISEEEKRINKIMYDSLSNSGKHGYYVIPFIVGRIRTAPELPETMPFRVTVSKIAPELLDHSIHFRILDSVTYQIDYSFSETNLKALKGRFGSPLENTQLDMVVSRSGSFLQQDTSVLESLKMIDFLFKVHSY